MTPKLFILGEALVQRHFFGGGGGSSPSAEQNQMYAAQAHQADLASGAYEKYGLPGIAQMQQMGNDAKSNANKQNVTDKSLQSSAAAFGNNMRMSDAQQASYGGPTSERQSAIRQGQAAGAAAGAGSAADQAREAQDQKGNALLSDATSLGLGQAATAQNALNSATSTANTMQAQNLAGQQSNANAWGNIAGAAGWGLTNASKIADGASTVASWFADGGYVDHEPGYAFGGSVGLKPLAQQQVQPMQQTPVQQPQGSPLGSAINAYRTADRLVDAASKGFGSGVDAATSQAWSQGAGLGGDTLGAVGANAAPAAVAAPVAEGATAAGLGEAAATGAGAAGAGSAGLAALGPVGWAVGAGLLANELFAKDGGAIPGIGGAQAAGRAENRAGGTVDGPGGPKDDMVPARLSPGEFVMPVEAVQYFGLKRLESMRQTALQTNRGAQR
jgi:hypothetical protein